MIPKVTAKAVDVTHLLN